MSADDREAIESSVEAVFLQHASSPPHSLPRGLYASVVAPPMVKPRERAGSPFEPGLEKLERVIEKRVAARVVFGDARSATLRTLVEASGGYVKDLLRMMRDLVKRGFRSGFPVREGDVAAIVDSLAEDYRLVVDAQDIDVLIEIDRSKQLLEPDSQRLESPVMQRARAMRRSESTP